MIDFSFVVNVVVMLSLIIVCVIKSDRKLVDIVKSLVFVVVSKSRIFWM